MSGGVLALALARDKASVQTLKPYAPGRPRPSAFPRGQLVVSLSQVSGIPIIQMPPGIIHIISSTWKDPYLLCASPLLCCILSGTSFLQETFLDPPTCFLLT